VERDEIAKIKQQKIFEVLWHIFIFALEGGS
jgi:hypothetical protein